MHRSILGIVSYKNCIYIYADNFLLTDYINHIQSLKLLSFLKNGKHKYSEIEQSLDQKRTGNLTRILKPLVEMKLINKRYPIIAPKVFVIKSSAIPISYLLLLKERCYSAEFILYLWDDLSIDSGEKERLRFFNKIYSFSKFDCEKYGFNFRPMFYNDSLVPTIINKSIDLFYVASYKESRFRFIKKLYSNNNLTSIHKKIILRCSIFLFLKKIEHLKYIRCFRMTPIKYDKMVDYLSRSRCSLEIQHPGQTGLTTRPIEALLTKTKIITTNKSIVDYSIYCPENIKIIEELSPHIDVAWLKEPYKEYPSEILEFYSLHRFIQDVLT